MPLSSDLSIRRLLLREILISLGLATVLLLGLRGLAEFWSIRAQAITQASQGFRLLKDNLDHRVRSAEALGETLAVLWSRGEIAPDQPHSEPLLDGLLRQSGAQNLILVDLQGRVVNANHLEEGYRTRSLVQVDGHPRLRQSTWGGRGTPDATEILGFTPPDYLDRPWSRQALAGGPAWTDPYVFINPPVPGVTYCRKVTAPDGRVLGALGVDLRLSELALQLGDYRPTEHARTYLTTSARRILAGPGVSEPGPGDGGPQDPLCRAALDSADAVQAWPEVRVGGQSWLLHRETIQGPGWVLVSAIPVMDLAARPRRITLAALGVGALALLLIGLRLMLTARKITVPLVALARSSQDLMDGKPTPLPETRIRELALAGEALRSAAATLQERRGLEAELQRVQRLELVGTMAAGLAHDMNNHLTAIQGQVELALKKSPEGPHAPFLARAHEACARMGRILLDLVAFGRPREIAVAPVDLNALVEEAGRLLEHSRGKRMRIELDLDPRRPVVAGDRIQLEQVILNLGFNAKDASPEDGRLGLRTQVRGQEACFEISDTGTGMTADVREKLFTPYFTTKGEGGGSGLGLAMVASLVKAHGGRILVESEPGLGSVFTIWLPLAKEAP